MKLPDKIRLNEMTVKSDEKTDMRVEKCTRRCVQTAPRLVQSNHRDLH